MRLEGRQIAELSKYLRGAFNLNKFDQLLLCRLEKNREDISLAGDFESIVFDVIRDANASDWTVDLILAALAARPKNIELINFAESLRLMAETPKGPELERRITKANGSLNPVQWREKLASIESQVCRVDIIDMYEGTGFLIGPDLVMTNYHVLQRLYENTVTRSQVQFRFDYKALGDGRTVTPGVVFKLHEDWQIDYSKYSQSDVQRGVETLPAEDELDYAIVRLADSPGETSAMLSADDSGSVPHDLGPPRKWIQLNLKEHQYLPGTMISIVHHPSGEPLKLDLDSSSILDLNANKTRVRYRTNTENGSSGSPCFNADWELVALHHSGDKSFTNPTYNQGIPITNIVRMVSTRGLSSTIGI